MSKNKVMGFEIPYSNADKANEFYGKIFDWELKMMEGGFMVNTVKTNSELEPQEFGGINGGIYPRGAKNQYPTLMVETESIDETLKKIEALGGEVLSTRHPIDDLGFMADFADPDGNEMTLWEKAKK